jgi:hypothetical protein
MGLTYGSGTLGVGVMILLLGTEEVVGVFWLTSRSLVSARSGLRVKGLDMTGQSTIGLVSVLEDV